MSSIPTDRSGVDITNNIAGSEVLSYPVDNTTYSEIYELAYTKLLELGTDHYQAGNLVLQALRNPNYPLETSINLIIEKDFLFEDYKEKIISLVKTLWPFKEKVLSQLFSFKKEVYGNRGLPQEKVIRRSLNEKGQSLYTHSFNERAVLSELARYKKVATQITVEKFAPLISPKEHHKRTFRPIDLKVVTVQETRPRMNVKKETPKIKNTSNDIPKKPYLYPLTLLDWNKKQYPHIFDETNLELKKIREKLELEPLYLLEREEAVIQRFKYYLKHPDSFGESFFYFRKRLQLYYEEFTILTGLVQRKISLMELNLYFPNEDEWERIFKAFPENKEELKAIKSKASKSKISVPIQVRKHITLKNGDIHVNWEKFTESILHTSFRHLCKETNSNPNKVAKILNKHSSLQDDVEQLFSYDPKKVPFISIDDLEKLKIYRKSKTLTFGEAIFYARKTHEKLYTVSELAHAIGVYPTHIQRIESNHAIPLPATLKKIDAVLNTDLEFLYQIRNLPVNCEREEKITLYLQKILKIKSYEHLVRFLDSIATESHQKLSNKMLYEKISSFPVYETLNGFIDFIKEAIPELSAAAKDIILLLHLRIDFPGLRTSSDFSASFIYPRLFNEPIYISSREISFRKKIELYIRNPGTFGEEFFWASHRSGLSANDIQEKIGINIRDQSLIELNLFPPLEEKIPSIAELFGWTEDYTRSLIAKTAYLDLNRAAIQKMFKTDGSYNWEYFESNPLPQREKFEQIAKSLGLDEKEMARQINHHSMKSGNVDTDFFEKRHGKPIYVGQGHTQYIHLYQDYDESFITLGERLFFLCHQTNQIVPESDEPRFGALQKFKDDFFSGDTGNRLQNYYKNIKLPTDETLRKFSVFFGTNYDSLIQSKRETIDHFNKRGFNDSFRLQLAKKHAVQARTPSLLKA